jgi:hypothetical protein
MILRIVAYLDGLSEQVNALQRLQSESQVELPLPLRSGGAARDALLPSVLDRALRESCYIIVQTPLENYSRLHLAAILLLQIYYHRFVILDTFYSLLRREIFNDTQSIIAN